MALDEFGRAFLACYFGFVAIHYTARLKGLSARTGYGHAEPGRVGTANWRHQMVFRAFRVAIFLFCAVRVPFPGVDAVALPLPLPGAVMNAMLLAGIALMGCGLAIVDYVGAYMGREWRSGVAGPAGEHLLTSGPYRLTRNPMFVGVIAGQVGFALAAPSVFSLACLAVGIVVLSRQVGVEEAELARRFGAAYGRYRRTTPRWFGLTRADRPAAGRRFGTL